MIIKVKSLRRSVMDNIKWYDRELKGADEKSSLLLNHLKKASQNALEYLKQFDDEFIMSDGFSSKEEYGKYFEIINNIY